MTIGFKEVLDATDAGVELVDDDWRISYRNSFCANLHVSRGHEPSYGIGQNFWTIYPHFLGTDVEVAFRRAMDKREAAVIRFPWPTPRQEMMARAYPMHDGGVALFFRDVTAWARIDDREAFLLRLSDRTRAISDPRAIMSLAAEMLGRQLKLAFVQYVMLLEDEDEAEVAAVYNDGRLPGVVPGVRFKFSERAPAWRDLHRVGRPVYTEDRIADDRPLNEGTTSAVAMRAGASIPLMKEGKLVAMLGVGLPEAHRWTSSEKELLNDVAERTWVAADRARVEAVMRLSENKYRTLFEEMDEAFALAELVRDEKGKAIDYRYLEFNRAVTKQGGIASSQMLGRLRSEAFPGVPNVALEVYERVVATQAPERVEYYEPALGRWLSLQAFPRGGEQFATLYSDITARKLSEDRQKYLLEISDLLRPLRNPDAILLAATAALAKHLDAQRAYYVDYSAEGFAIVRNEHKRDDAPTLLGNLSLKDFKSVYESLRTGKPLVIEDWETFDTTPEARAVIRSRGIRAQLSIPLLKEGKLVATMSLSDSRARKWQPNEITLMQETADRTWAALERARAESALRALLIQAEKANQAKDEFLATLSHELRTPLAAILLWGQALRSGKVKPAELNRAVEAIVHSAESQSQLIDDLLDLSRLTAGKLTLASAPIDVGSVARSAVDVIRPIAEAKHLSLVAKIPMDLGRAQLDSARFKQVLWNLLNNAVKFTPEGGTVTLTLSHDGELDIEVTDTGEGIASDLLPRVFEKFWQADMGEARQHMGLGIGLALVKQLVELQGGSIEARSDGPGKGATFRAKLPWIPVDGPRATSAPPPPENALAGLVALLVEDDANTRAAMAWMLEKAGATVVTAENGREALEALDRNTPPSVIVCDLGLPEMTGYELIAKISEDSRRRGIAPPPSCAVSAHAREADRERAIAAGFDMYLSKPIVPRRFIEAVIDLRDVLRRVD